MTGQELSGGRSIAAAAQPETMTLQEVWNAAGGNPGIVPTKQDVLDALKELDEAVDECDERHPATVQPVTDAESIIKDINELTQRADKMGRSRGANNYCNNRVALDAFVDLKIALESRIRAAYAAPTSALPDANAGRQDVRNSENFQKLVDALERIYKDEMCCAAEIAADTLVDIGYWERTGGSAKSVMPSQQERSTTISAASQTATIADLKDQIEYWKERERKAVADLNMRRQKETGEVWYWQHDGGNHVESLTCPIVIPAQEFRALTAAADDAQATAQDAKDAARYRWWRSDWLRPDKLNRWCPRFGEQLKSGGTMWRGIQTEAEFDSSIDDAIQSTNKGEVK